MSVSGAATATFYYDGDGNRVKGTIGGVTSTYIGNYFEWTGSTTTMNGRSRYYYEGATRVAVRTGTATINYLLGDHLGSQSITTDSSGNQIAQTFYYPWGGFRYSSGSTPTSFGFTGQRWESSLNLYYYGARWYDPYLARWVQPDSVIPEQTQGVQAWDRYAYVNNNPVKYTDPTGHCLVLCTAFIGGVVGAAVNIGMQITEGIAKGESFGEAINKIVIKEVVVYAVAGAVTGATFGAINPAITGALLPSLEGVGTTISGAFAGAAGGQAAALTDAVWNQGGNLVNGQPINGEQFYKDAQNAGFMSKSQVVFDGVTGGFLAGVSSGIVNELINPQPLLLGSAKAESAVLQGIGASFVKPASTFAEETAQQFLDQRYKMIDTR